MIFVFDPVHQDVRTWTHCEIEGLCFVVTIRCMQSGQRNRAAIVDCAWELRHYLLSAKNVEIEQVQMMCPPSISGRDEWALEKLESINIYAGVETDESAVVYRTIDKSYKLGELDLRKKKTSRVIYSARQLSDYHATLCNAHQTAPGPKLYTELWVR